MRVLAMGALLFSLAACNSIGADTGIKPAQKPATGKTLPAAPPPPSLPDDRIVCPADVLQCADGSYVSRNPDNGCAFNPCPGAVKP